LLQDGLHIYYSPRFARQSDTIELGYVRVLFRHKLVVSGPEVLLANVVMGRV